MIKQMPLTIATFFTGIRLLFAPLLFPFLLVYLLPYDTVLIKIFLGLLFLLFAITDFLDGYYARRYQQETVWGKVVDPLADKCLIISTFIALLAIGKIWFFWVILFVLRDLFLMGFRMYAYERGLSLVVSYKAKFKTGMQMMLIMLLIAQPYAHLSPMYAFVYMISETILLYSTLFFSYATVIDYYFQFKDALES